MVSQGVNGARRLTAARRGIALLGGLILAGAGRSACAEGGIALAPAGAPATVAVSAAQTTLPIRGGTTLSAKVTDSAGVPVAGAIVNFSLVDASGGGSVTPGGLTNEGGVATASLVVGGTPGACTVRVTVAGGAAPVAIIVIEVAPPVPHLNRNYFNPSKGERLRIAVDIPAPAQFAVSVVGLTGEVVRRIESGAFASGSLVREWDGRTETGETAPSGVYFVRVQNGSTLQIRRVIVLRI